MVLTGTTKRRPSAKAKARRTLAVHVSVFCSVATQSLDSGMRGLHLAAARIRRNQPKARMETCLVLIRNGESPWEVLEAAHGALREYRLIDDLTREEIFGGPET